MSELTDHISVQRIAFFQCAAQEIPESFTISSIQSLIEM